MDGWWARRLMLRKSFASASRKREKCVWISSIPHLLSWERCTHEVLNLEGSSKGFTPISSSYTENQVGLPDSVPSLRWDSFPLLLHLFLSLLVESSSGKLWMSVSTKHEARYTPAWLWAGNGVVTEILYPRAFFLIQFARKLVWSVSFRRSVFFFLNAVIRSEESAMLL